MKACSVSVTLHQVELRVRPSVFALDLHALAATGVVHERTAGTPSTVIRQFGQSPVPQYRPRRRWYFSDRVNVRTPCAVQRRGHRVTVLERHGGPFEVEGPVAHGA